MPDLNIPGTYTLSPGVNLAPLLETVKHSVDNDGDIEIDIRSILSQTLYIISLRQSLEKTIQELRCDIDKYSKLEKLWLKTGAIKKMFILTNLRRNAKPVTLQTLCGLLEKDREFQKNLPSKSKNTVRSVLKKLIQLGYVDQLDRGVYEISKRGLNILSRIESPF
jgi:hypothetical protein